MGKLKINGVDILTYFTPVPSSEVGTQHSAFPSKIKGLTTEVDNGSKKVLIGWELSNANNYSSNSNYDSANGKIKISGKVAPVIIDGTRPRNISVLSSITGCGLTYYINNVDGNLYLSTSANSVSGTHLVRSKAPNKDCLINLACWGSGGKGGGGAYWFLVGNWGGVGGAGGGKLLLTVCVKNNDHFKIVTESDGDKKGRTTDSSDYTIESPAIRIYNSSGSQWCYCEGGRSGTGNHPRWSQDDYGGGGAYSVQTYETLPIIRRRYSKGANKIENGRTGNACVGNAYQPYPFGCPEGNQGSIITRGEGGQGPDSAYTQVHGSGGGGSYGNGGKAGDTGSGSGGSAGDKGAGGGGGGSPAGGCAGGDGGLPGFIIFY